MKTIEFLKTLKIKDSTLFLALIFIYPIVVFLIKEIGFLQRPTAIFSIWFPAGVSLLFLLISTNRKLALKFLFIVIFFTHMILLEQPFYLAFFMALSNLCGVWLTYALLKPIKNKSIFEDISLIESFLVSLLIGATVSSLLGISILFLFGYLHIQSVLVGTITYLVGNFLGMLIVISPYFFIQAKDFKNKLKKIKKPLFWGNTILTMMFTYYLFASSYLSHVEFFILVPLLIILLRFRELGIYINGILVLFVGMFVLYIYKDLDSFEPSYTMLELQTFMFFLFTASYILVSTLNQSKALLKYQEDVVEETLITFARFIEEKDAYTAGHSRRVAQYAVEIAKRLDLPKKDLDLLYRAGLVHDIGKIITPESVLLKPGNLTSTEYALMKQHASVGSEMISRINHFKPLAKIVRHHHEKYDGSGYPDGLAREKIPLLSRVLCVADAFDAMTTTRIYKPRKNIKEAVEELESQSGLQFDPNVVEKAVGYFESIDSIQAYEQDIIKFATQEEAERFAYFFKDSLTGLFNTIYLNTILNQHSSSLRCVNIVCIRGMGEYNLNFGWTKGDELLRSFGAFLQNSYPKALLFRVYGDDFIILHEEHKDINILDFKNFTPIRENLISLDLLHLDLRDKSVYNVEDIEAYLLEKTK